MGLYLLEYICSMDMKEVEQLEIFFNGLELPEQVQLDSGTRILNVESFVKDNIATLKLPGISGLAADTRLWRLRKLKEVLSMASI